MPYITLEQVVQAWKNGEELESSNGELHSTGMWLMCRDWIIGITHKNTGKKLALDGRTRKYDIDRRMRKYANLADRYADEVYVGQVLLGDWLFPLDVLRDAFGQVGNIPD